MYWVYILDNYIKKDYISVTIDIDARIKEHQQQMLESGHDSALLRVVYQEYYESAIEALDREKELKSMSRLKLKDFIESRGSRRMKSISAG